MAGNEYLLFRELNDFHPTVQHGQNMHQTTKQDATKSNYSAQKVYMKKTKTHYF